MGESDFKFLVICVLFLAIYGAFLILFAGSELSEPTKPGIDQKEKSFWDGIIPDTSFLNFMNPLSEGFNTEFVIISVLIFTPVLIILGIIGIRLLRGV